MTHIATVEETNRFDVIESAEWIAVYKPGLQKALKELNDSRFRLRAVNDIERKLRLAVLAIAQAHPEFEELRAVTLQLEELRYALEGEIWA